MTALALFGSVAAVCVSGLVAWRWWLVTRRQERLDGLEAARAKRADIDARLEAALNQLGEWERRLVRVETGRAFGGK